MAEAHEPTTPQTMTREDLTERIAAVVEELPLEALAEVVSFAEYQRAKQQRLEPRGGGRRS